jgi:hypothetical protein
MPPVFTRMAAFKPWIAQLTRIQVPSEGFARELSALVPDDSMP